MMIKFKINETLTIAMVDRMVREYPYNEICIVLDNTKKQSPSELEYIGIKYKNRITISVLGGLNPQKNKYDTIDYQKRTYYTPIELSKIIRIFQSIERKINISWTETQKAMFIYQELCNHMEYSEIEVNGRDCARNLCGLIYKKAVCSGFALILKEALDRIGMYNIYQNKSHHHSWNIAYLDGEYRALELTWDCGNKTEEGCQFLYFNYDKDFYKNKHHDISNENEEKQYKIVPYTEKELRENYYHISQKRIITIQLNIFKNIKISIQGNPYILKVKNKKLIINGNNSKEYIRKDGSRFYLVSLNQYKQLNKFIYFELRENQIIGARLYSDVRLNDLDSNYSDDIANALLSQERLKRKIEQFNGYVGYIGTDHRMYYDGDFETNSLNIIR